MCALVTGVSGGVSNSLSIHAVTVILSVSVCVSGEAVWCVSRAVCLSTRFAVISVEHVLVC